MTRVKTLMLMLVLVEGCSAANNPAEAPDLAMQDPADAIVNGPDRSSATTYWISTGAVGYSDFKFALFADHTGAYDANFGNPNVVAITWQKLSPANIAVTGADQLPSLIGIKGSVASGACSGSVSGGLGSFTIAGGTL
jgi:hypothetical protein